jgi:hypothetical protein
MKTALSAAVALLITSIPIVGHADQIPFYETNISSQEYWLDCYGPWVRRAERLTEVHDNRVHFYSAGGLFPYGGWTCTTSTMLGKLVSRVDFTVCDRPQNEISLTIQPDSTLTVTGNC